MAARSVIYIAVLLFCGTVSSLQAPSGNCSRVYTSCQEMYLRNKCNNINLLSGMYMVNGGDVFAEVYCDMQGSLCGGEGGWMRIAAHDMTITGSECPLGLNERQLGGKSLCGRVPSGCSSVKFNANGIPFNEVCGFVQAYQFGTPDAFYRGGSIDGPYFDGISITTGNPRKHVWSLAAGLSSERRGRSSCPCNSGNTNLPPQYVGNAYYCESGNAVSGTNGNQFYDDVLWDGKGCTGLETSCCQSQQPYFNVKFPEASTSFIEMRLCHDAGGEDVPIEAFEFFVR